MEEGELQSIRAHLRSGGRSLSSMEHGVLGGRAELLLPPLFEPGTQFTKTFYGQTKIQQGNQPAYQRSQKVDHILRLLRKTWDHSNPKTT